MKKLFFVILFVISATHIFTEDNDIYLTFLKENSFSVPPWHTITFEDNGIYRLTAPNDPNMGTYEVSGNTVTLSPYICYGYPDTEYYRFETENNYRINLPAKFEICPDEENLFCTGCLKHGNIRIWSTKESYSESIYSYEGYKVKRFPKGKDTKYLFIEENTKMRKKPNINAETVTLGYMSYKNFSFVKRHVAYKGELIPILGASVFTETIDGITSCWYLVLEDDKTDCMDTESKKVWIFGGWAKEIEPYELDLYKKISAETVK